MNLGTHTYHAIIDYSILVLPNFLILLKPTWQTCDVGATPALLNTQLCNFM
jgi:hypothetical protein